MIVKTQDFSGSSGSGGVFGSFGSPAFTWCHQLKNKPSHQGDDDHVHLEFGYLMIFRPVISRMTITMTAITRRITAIVHNIVIILIQFIGSGTS